jgi:hypothetical protein
MIPSRIVPRRDRVATSTSEAPRPRGIRKGRRTSEGQRTRTCGDTSDPIETLLSSRRYSSNEQGADVQHDDNALDRVVGRARFRARSFERSIAGAQYGTLGPGNRGRGEGTCWVPCEGPDRLDRLLDLSKPVVGGTQISLIPVSGSAGDFAVHGSAEIPYLVSVTSAWLMFTDIRTHQSFSVGLSEPASRVFVRDHERGGVSVRQVVAGRSAPTHPRPLRHRAHARSQAARAASPDRHRRARAPRQRQSAPRVELEVQGAILFQTQIRTLLLDSLLELGGKRRAHDPPSRAGLAASRRGMGNDPSRRTRTLLRVAAQAGLTRTFVAVPRIRSAGSDRRPHEFAIPVGRYAFAKHQPRGPRAIGACR